MNNQLSSYKKIKNLFEQYPELEYDKLCYYIGICNTKEDVSDEETLKLMAICDKCCAFLTGCYTGMRTGEVFALTWDDINLDKRIININKTVYAKDKEESGRWYLGTTKTSDSQREVYICDSLYAVLIAYKNIQNNLKRQYGKKYKRYILEEVKNKFGKLVEYKIVESYSKNNRVEMVFTRKDGKYSGTDVIRYPFKIIHHELRINCRFYDLRGSFATKALRNGNEIKDISKLLGHSRIETTENYYITSTTNDLIKICESIEKK